MKQLNAIKGLTEDEVWGQIEEHFFQNPDLLEYSAAIDQGDKRVVLDIDIDLGGGFESGYETTSFTAPIGSNTGFRFAIHEEHFTDETGKFFGMQDLEIGYRNFDEKLVIKTNDQPKIKEIFEDGFTRESIQSLQNFTFGITTRDVENSQQRQAFLKLVIEAGITDVVTLRNIYKAFLRVLDRIDGQ